MSIYETYSKRQARLNDDQVDVYQYKHLPDKLKNQIIHIWNDVIGNYLYISDETVSAYYGHIHKILCREMGAFVLPHNDYNTRGQPSLEVIGFFSGSRKLNENLDVVELIFKIINTEGFFKKGEAEKATNELNIRFKESAVGYQFLNNEIIRIDSEIIHSEAVVPALRLLNQKEYANAESEFLKAHEAYRKGENGTAILECNKAFESVMKVIIHKQGWLYDSSENATDSSERKAKTKASASGLIKVCFENQLFPDYLQSQLTSLRTLLESSIPTIRNKNDSHGAGLQTADIPASLASFTLHMTASTVLFLIECETRL
ncbi:STM4504/CBY_0614 family protein [Pseudoalteromonas sp. S983]|uniref:STM4504/CBY_0614 family protein n=1 Tax=Pseudoalteromonas sp. S983 TaxID=579572 RepID=UPI00110BFB85|nr:hypothetical protein [Pseudoalteromonas sp. S983]TMP85093.1 hypothetical protein CWB71_01525 [Pseudoalteromonas sp. S983]USN27041.1 hypothetical protein [synthetic construct]